MMKLIKTPPPTLLRARFATVLDHLPSVPSVVLPNMSLVETDRALLLLKLINKGREAGLPEIITAFIQQYKAKKGIYIVKLTTATPVSDELKNSIINQVKKTSVMQNIELEEKVDPAIIGGFVLQAGDKLIDASIAYDLQTISRQFDNNDFIYKVR